MSDKKTVSVSQQSLGETQESLINALSTYLKTIPQDDFFGYLQRYLEGVLTTQVHIDIVTMICKSMIVETAPKEAIELLFDELDNLTKFVNPPQEYLDTIGLIFDKLCWAVTDEDDKNRLLRQAYSYLRKNEGLTVDQKAALGVINEIAIVKL